MRKLMAMFAMVLVSATATKSWAVIGLGDVSFDGSMEVSGNSANNETDFSASNDHRGNTVTRVRLGMNADVTEGVTGRLELARTPASAGALATYGGAGKPSSVAGEEGAWVFHNAFVYFDNLLGHKVRLGRQYVGDPGDLVWHIGPKSDDSLTITSIDGLLVQNRMWDKLAIDFFTGKSFDDDGVANTDAGDAAGDINFNNLGVGIALAPEINIGLAYQTATDSNATVRGDDNKLQIARVGVKGGVRDNWLTYRAEYLQNMGEFKGAGLTGAGAATNLDYEGNAIDLGVGLNIPETGIGGWSFWGNWISASGDDNIRDDKDESFHDFTSFGVNTSDRYFGEIFGKSNTLGGGIPLGQGVDTADATATAPSLPTQGQGLQVINIGTQFKPTWWDGKTWARLDYYMFARGEDNVRNAAGTNVNVGDDFGSEWNITLGYNHSDNVRLEGGYAMLMVDDALTGIGNVPDEDVTKLFGRATVRWGGESQ